MKTLYIGNLGICLCLGLLCLPFGSFAQSMGERVGSLQSVLDQVYEQMMPLCSGLISAGRGIAGFGALWYISSRVWRQIAQAEPIDVYPLLRPFALGLAILLFPAVIWTMNGVLGLSLAGTKGMVRDSDRAIRVLLKEKELAMQKTDKWKAMVGVDGLGNREIWYDLIHPDDPGGKSEGWIESVYNDFRFWADKQDYKMRHAFKTFIGEVLEIVYQAAALCVNTLRTFFLIVLAILGPVVLGFAVYDGLQHTLSVWIARYINIYLWLPIANIFGAILGKIQQNMIKLDISEIQTGGDTLFSTTDICYFIFLIIGILGYFSVPTVANYVVHAGGGNAILMKVNSIVASTASALKGSVRSNLSFGGKRESGMSADGHGDAYRKASYGMAEGAGKDYFKDKLSGN
ncbi:Bacteroides conjugative transposon TraJ protein [Pedobacter steynii]|uniref:Bacteroides conjugative transposon TraJ protein n=1 Tax=Pedobacter steynii TaxID=430522 RepID=A0A1G9K6M1_9SPHI|nr:conjugative transposon protein TraJ [Pedobacter steynii]NQX38452.1 conjugative transposon protein TraJ [Pedobacter steynii]SDL44903.1 Bacteroides conjugative transposon TraJ protein [Pedobacter steynii]